MTFEIDVLIVYSDRDNHGQGWVTSLKNFLEPVLEQVIGRKPNVILKGEFDTLTSPSLDNAGVLVAVLSDAFAASTACHDYLQKFAAATQSTSGLLNRVFKVYKTPVPVDDQPPSLRQLFGYELFHSDLDSGEIRDFTDYFSREAERQYWMELVELSYDVYDTLYYLQEQKTISEVRKIYGRKTIYLAQTSYDLTVERNIIHRELQRMGYTVLPSRALPGTLQEFEQVVRQDLANSSMSIHLIGSLYGETVGGTDRSVQEIQHRLAADRGVHSRNLGEEHFHRLIWISAEGTTIADRQKRFIEFLRRDAESSEDAEILEASLEDFKTIIREELHDSQQKRSLDDSGGKAIYLMHDRVDGDAAKPYMDMIVNAGFELLKPDFTGGLTELRQKHIDNLRRLDGAVIFKGHVNEQWVRMKVLDLMKAPGFGRKRPIVGKVVVTSGARLSNSEVLKRENLSVIDGNQQESLESLRTFLLNLKSGY